MATLYSWDRYMKLGPPTRQVEFKAVTPQE